MRIHGYTLKNRRGVGAIIGGAFFLLIMLVGYMVYSFSIQAINNQQQVLSDMRAYDIERSWETFKIYGKPELILDYLTVSIQNIGPKTVNIICIGLWDGIKWDYDSSSFIRVLGEPFTPVMIQSGSYRTFEAHIPGIDPANEEWVYKLQFLTDKGTIYEVGYFAFVP